MTNFLDVENGDNASLQAPGIVIALLTYERTAEALRTIQGVIKNLDYPRELRTFYIADDGSRPEHIQIILKFLEENQETVCGYHFQSFAQRPACGIGWNKAVEVGHQFSDIILWLEDDWELEHKLDIRPYIRLLLERQEVGMISMRGLTDGLRTEVATHRGIHYLEILRNCVPGTMAYSGNPLLRHKRYFDYYGMFTIHTSPGDIEIFYDNRYVRGEPHAPEIWRPAALNEWGCFGHIGRERTW